MSRPTFALVALLLPLLAGCMGGGTDQRDDSLFFHIDASGPYEAVLPMPLDDRATSSRWEDRIFVSLGDAQVTPANTPFGPAMRITGSTSADIEAHLVFLRIRGGADAFLDGAWSTGSTTPPESLRIHVVGNVTGLNIKYEATSCRGVGCHDSPQDFTRSQVCWIETRAHIQAPPPGWSEVAATDTRGCT